MNGVATCQIAKMLISPNGPLNCPSCDLMPLVYFLRGYV